MICIVENVHTGDGGVLKLGDKVGGLSPEVLEILKSNKQIAKPDSAAAKSALEEVEARAKEKDSAEKRLQEKLAARRKARQG